MKFYDIHEPYFALIKAKDKESARNIYVEGVAEDDGTVMKELREVDRDYAVVVYSRSLGEDGNTIPVHEIVETIQDDEEAILLIDGALL